MNKAERDEAILSLATLVEIKSRRTVKQLGYGVALDDVRSAAWSGAIEAVDKFDSTRGDRLVAYADAIIKGRILDWQRSVDPLKRDHRTAIKAGLVEAPKMLHLDTSLDLTESQNSHADNALNARIDVTRLLAHLTPRYRAIVERYYLDELCMKQVAEEFGVNESRISQIVGEALKKMRSHAIGQAA